jgi:hypothetical protein
MEYGKEYGILKMENGKEELGVTASSLLDSLRYDKK